MRHFGKAAKRCFVSQPTLSTQLKKVEEELGLSLFERTNKSVMITPVGEQILEQAKKILHHLESIKKMAESSKDSLSGSFRLGIIPTLGPYLLPYILKGIKSALPKLELIIYENKTEVILSELHHGYLDAIILALPIKHEGLIQQHLFHEPFYIALPKQHQLASQEKISMKAIQEETLLLLEEGHCLREQALEACKFSGHYASDFRATSLETLRHIVALGSGVTLLPALAVKSSRAEKEIVIKSIAGNVPTREVGMLWRSSTLREGCCHKMVAIIQKHIQGCDEINAIAKKSVLTKVIGGTSKDKIAKK
ncbi:MAG: DNA-binding transcriptional regulator OxyR [Coxiella sp. RIFCSPHIGHO2_12_FULL_42_15]|nr:MAG: DNA-binding transcriptional regulator OxyR [Coxiella sp. RIFCSPHIGHO2_12_FULL_42_15]